MHVNPLGWQGPKRLFFFFGIKNKTFVRVELWDILFNFHIFFTIIMHVFSDF